MSKFTFRGLMAPVFTVFNEDNSVNVDSIKKYAEYLKKNEVNGVLVNGTTGEGMSLSVSERKSVTEAWTKVCKELDIALMVQIGGAPYPDVVELAKHAYATKVPAMLCLPELYFKPKTEEDLVDYLKSVSKHAPGVALFYYHIPMFTGVSLNMPRFINLAKASIPEFAGIKYSNGDLEQISPAVESGVTVFIGSDMILCSALTLGFDSSIMTTLNICPELSVAILKAVKEGRTEDAKKLQWKLNKRVMEITENGKLGWIPSMKREFNKVQKEKGLFVGKVRAPLKDLE
ncbi:N-acetylneuraminate lyase A-like [Culicoides brevitarsis]|uniref:N-acetylneuraminate lyase A-like n=1 Tax=Culicoides brevitarsis TaxID=469753 RepID=UPI00307C303D